MGQAGDVASRIGRLLGERHVRHTETWSSGLAREPLLSEVARRLVLLGGDAEPDGPSRLVGRTGSFWATARAANARWPMRWSIEVGDADPSVVTVEVVDALPSRMRPGSHRLYLRAIRKATAEVRLGLANDP